jgi:hypothetical protein
MSWPTAAPNTVCVGTPTYAEAGAACKGGIPGAKGTATMTLTCYTALGGSATTGCTTDKAKSLIYDGAQTGANLLTPPAKDSIVLSDSTGATGTISGESFTCSTACPAASTGVWVANWQQAT